MKFLSGFAVGFGLGILFAPAEGKRTREKVVRMASKLAQPDDLSDPAPTGSSTGDRNSHSIPTSEEREAPSLDDAVVQTLNTAKKNELMSVRGIGNATAKRIIKNRPYSSVEEVIEKEVVPDETLDNVKTQFTEKSEDAA